MRTTTVPAGNHPLHSVVQAMPLGVLRTLPSLLPAILTVSMEVKEAARYG